MTSRTRTELPYIPALDGVRGAGVLGILLFHAGEIRGGWLGVDLFFVLSGFLITSLLLAEQAATGRISLGRFWVRRGKRLLPALFAVIIGVSAYATVFAEPAALARIRYDAIAALFYVANWYAIHAGHDYWMLFRAPSPLDHAWSLSIEEQFYLFWPPLAYFVLRRSSGSARHLGVVAAVLALLSAAWMVWLFDEQAGTARVYYGTDTRAFATLVGSALAALYRREVRDWPGTPRRSADRASLVAGVILAVAWVALDGSDPAVYRGLLFGLAVLAAVVIRGAILAPGGITSRALGLAPLRFLGVISYGVYLWHWPLYLVLTPARTGIDGVSLTLGRIAASVCIATLSYYAIERPIRRGRLAPRPLAGLAIAGAALAIACVLGATRGATRPDGAVAGGESRTAEQAGRAQPSADPGAGRPDLLLVGDSQAEILGTSFEARARERDLRVLRRGRLGCTVLETDRVLFPGGKALRLPHCEPTRAEWYRVARTLRPRLVLVVEAGASKGDPQIDGAWRRPCEAEYDRALERDLSAAVRSFADSGARTVITTTPVPVPGDGPLRDGGLSKLVSERMACHNGVVRRVAERSGATVIDLAEFVCPEGVCRLEIDGVVLRSDGVHFHGDAGRLASDWILDQLDSLELVGHRAP